MPTSRRTSSIDLRSSVSSIAVDDDAAALPVLEPVDAAQQRRLSAARRPADHDALAAHDLQIDVAQHVEGAEPLVHAHHLDGDLVPRGADVGRARSTARRLLSIVHALNALYPCSSAAPYRARSAISRS